MNKTFKGNQDLKSDGIEGIIQKSQTAGSNNRVKNIQNRAKVASMEGASILSHGIQSDRIRTTSRESKLSQRNSQGNIVPSQKITVGERAIEVESGENEQMRHEQILKDVFG